MTAPDQCCINVKKVLAKAAPSTHDPNRSLAGQFCCDATFPLSLLARADEVIE
jgi:hypothetical protein